MAKDPVPEGFAEYMRQLGHKGGKARLKKITPARRSEIARAAGIKSAEARKKRAESAKGLKRGAKKQ